MAQPEKRFQAGSCSASVFTNAFESPDGKIAIKSVVLQRTFKDKSGSFQHSSSFGVNDIPKAMLVLQKAYEHLVMGERQ